MPEPPPVNPITRYVLENPYPAGVVLLVVGVILVTIGLREGRLGRARLGLVPIVLAAAVLATGMLVVTAGERARRVTRAFVDAVVDEDLVAADNVLSDDVLLHLGATTNVGRDRDFIRSGLSRLAARFTVEENRVTMLRGYTVSPQRAVVHLACWTDVGMLGPSPSQWVVEVELESDGEWRIVDLTCITVNGSPPPGSW